MDTSESWTDDRKTWLEVTHPSVPSTHLIAETLKWARVVVTTAGCSGKPENFAAPPLSHGLRIVQRAKPLGSWVLRQWCPLKEEAQRAASRSQALHSGNV